MFGLGIWELLVILGIVVILFGAKRLPMIGEGLGGMITSFKKATKKENNEVLQFRIPFRWLRRARRKPVEWKSFTFWLND